MTLRHIKIFVAVCQFNSVTLAAEHLYLAQPAVSAALKELESHYHTKLFDRISRKLYITEDGKKLLNYAIHIISLFDEMEEQMKTGDASGQIRIGASITIGTCFLPSCIKQFQQVCPEVEARVTVSSSDDIEEKLLKNELDIGLIEGCAHSNAFVSHELCEDHLIFLCSLSHPFSGKENIPVARLQGEAFLLREPGSGTRETADSILLSHSIQCSPVWESTSTMALVRAVAANLGISLLPYELVKHELQVGTISSFTLEGVSLGRSFRLIHHKNKYLSPSMNSLISIFESQATQAFQKNQNPEKRYFVQL